MHTIGQNWSRDFGLSVNNYDYPALIWLTHGLKVAVFTKFKPLIIWIKMIFWSFYSSESCYLSEYTLMWFGGLFDICPEIFLPFNQVNGQSSSFNPLPELLNTGFTTIEIVLFNGEHLKANSWLFFDKVAIFT